MKSRLHTLTLIIIFALLISSTKSINSLPTNTVQVRSNLPPQLQITPSTPKLQNGLDKYMESNVIPDNFTGRIMVYASTPNIGVHTTIPPIKLGGTYLYFVDNVTPDIVRQLYVNTQVRTMIPDQKFNYQTSIHQSTNPSTPPQTQSLFAQDIMRTRQVHEQLGITGKGVTLGIIDSGIDFGVSDLSNAAKLNKNGYLASMDITGTGLGITSLTLAPVLSQGKEVLPLKDKELNIYLGQQKRIITTTDLGIQLQDLQIDNLKTPSVSNTYKVGMAAEESAVQELPTQYFLFVLVDSLTAGVYDRLYVDMETSLAISLSQAGIILPASQKFNQLNEYNLSNDDPFGPNNPIPAKDITGDGINDISMGGLGSIIDFTGLSGSFIFTGIHPSGSAIAMFFDPVGHGTLTASAAASDGKTKFPVYDNKNTPQVENATTYLLPGSAPDAKIVAAKAFSLSDFVLGWFWTGGLNLKVENSQAVWVEDSDNLADISSNSWGDGSVAPNGQLKGFDSNSLLLDYLSQPDSLYSGYPGMIFVVAAGNGAPGYGTASSPGMASMALTVGASTEYHYLNGSNGRNDVAWFSSRGPSGYGGMKPDIVAPGRDGFVNLQVIQGYGNGTYADGPFGGTSEATPRLAGVVALVFQAMKNQSITPTFEQIRLVLKATARDMGFDPTQQGAGLVDAYNAVLAVLQGIPIVASDYSSKLIGQNLEEAFYKMFQVEHPLFASPIDDFVATITPEELQAGIQLHIRYSNGTAIPASAYSVSVTRPELAFNSSTSIHTSDILFNQSIASIFPDNRSQYRMMELSLTMDQQTWNNMQTNGLTTPDLMLYETNNHHVVADLWSFNTWSQILYSGFPGADFIGTPLLSFEDPGYAQPVSSWPGMDYSLSTRFFALQAWNTIIVTQNNGILDLVDPNVANEYQTGYVKITVGSTEIMVPLVITPSHQASYADNLTTVGDGLSLVQPYNQYQITNTFDWGYRPESGDFLHYQISVPNYATFFAAFATWTDKGLTPSMYLFNSTGNLVAKTDVNYVGGGFYQTKSSEPFAQNLLVNATDTTYYLLVQNTALPFKTGPFDIAVHFRYLTLDSLPIPIPKFSQPLQANLTGNLLIDTSHYNVSEFPEFKIDTLSAQIYQGSHDIETRTILNKDLIGGVNRLYKSQLYDDFFTISAKKGDKIKVNLSWKGAIDADMIVIKLGDNITQANDLLHGAGTTAGTNAESGMFSAEETADYIVYIDYISGAGLTNDFTYTFSYESRTGPIITSDSSFMSLDTLNFPDDNYGLLLTLNSNFNYSFQIRYAIATDNSEPFSFSVTNPTPGNKISGDFKVDWQSSRAITVDLILEKANIQTLVGTSGAGATSMTFDSTIFTNGDAKLIFSATDGIYNFKITIPVTLDNRAISKLPPIQTSSANNLDFPLLMISGFSILTIVIFEKKKKNK